MKKIIKTPFLRQKFTMVILYIVFTLLSWACQNNVENDFDAAKEILGKWELIADGMSDDKMNERNHGTYVDKSPIVYTK